MDELVKVLVVDDDKNICTLVSKYLAEENFSVDTAENASDAWLKVDMAMPDVVLLDVRLPDGDGFAIAAQLREKLDCGIIMLTAKSDVVDRVMGLEIGADDYISKPFHLRELLARIRSVLRRRRSLSQKSEIYSVIEYEGGWLNLETRELWSAENEQVEITSKEFELLRLLLMHAGKVVTRTEIAQHFGSRKWNPQTRYIDVLVYQLRSKMEIDSRHPALIKTVRGTGYVFTGKIKKLAR